MRLVVDEADQLAAVDPEEQDDPPERVGDRTVDLGRGQVDEARRELGEQPFEREELMRGRGRGARVRFGQGTGQNGYPWVVTGQQLSWGARLGRVLCLLLSAAVAAAAPAAARAQGWAKQPLRILVPLPAGSQTDLVARLIADPLREQLAQPVVIDNRPGATGRIAVDALRSATPDGNTLLLTPIAVPVIVPLVFKDASYDPAKDFAPVAQVTKFEYALAVAASHPARTVPELVAWAKANPGRATFGTAGAGSVPHFLGVMLRQAAGIELQHVPYKGAATVEADLMSGQITAGITAIADLVPLDRAGKLRILATSGAERSPLLPAVPTFRERGYSAVEASGWHAVYAPAGTPKDVINRLSATIVAAVQTPELRAKLAALGIEPTGTTPEALAAIMADDIRRWRPIVKASGFTAE